MKTTIKCMIYSAVIASISLSANATHQSAYAPIITFNLANYDDHPNWEKRLELLADEVDNNHADIIVLQEVRFNPDAASSKTSYQNMAEELLSTLHNRHHFYGANIVTQPVMYYPDGDQPYPQSKSTSADKQSHSWEGLSIISRYKILETGTYFLTKADDCHDGNLRAIQYAKINVHENIYYIANAHFGLSSACISANIKESVQYLKRIAGNGRLILLGDFNTTPDDQNLHMLKQAGLVDIWDKFHPSEPGYTFPSSAPTKRIDYVFGNAPVAERIMSKDYVRLIGKNKKDGVYPSDHLGMVVEFLSYN
jgi:endonuclease/exonuclease/phosphatase family metal-dependent hydrolase